MFAKLFSRITESSLMEEPLDVRYAFVMLLAMCDPTGHVIGTDIAIARRMNMPLDDFQRCAATLMRPDPDSNSKEHEGRRIIPSEGERGYLVVNYLTYRDMKTEENRRDYMRDYMRKRREAEAVASGKQPVKRVKLMLAQLGHAEAELTEEGDKDKEGTITSHSASPMLEREPRIASSMREAFEEFWKAYPKKKARGDAERAWAKGKCTPLLPQILIGIRTAKSSQEWTKEFGQFIPHPATWLNSRGWEDETFTPVLNGKQTRNFADPEAYNDKIGLDGKPIK